MTKKHTPKAATSQRDGDSAGQANLLEALQASEDPVKKKLNALLEPEGDLEALTLADVIDCGQIQSLMNDFHALTNIGMAIVDLDGNVLVRTGWQDICTKFHRVHPDTAKNCLESDTLLASETAPGTFTIYTCKNNMRDMATPIMIGEKRMGTLFLGQFLFDDEAPDVNVFREQAKRHGFDEDSYLAAYHSVPRWSRQTVDQAMHFYCNLIGVIDRLSYAQIQLARSSESLRRSENLLRTIINSIPDTIYVKDAESRKQYANRSELQRTGFEREEDLIGKNDFDIWPPEIAKPLFEDDQRVLKHGERVVDREEKLIMPDGGTVWQLTTKTPLYDRMGKITGLVGIGRDITQRKRADDYRAMGVEVLAILNEPGVFTDTIQHVITALKTRTGFDAVGLRLQAGEDFPYHAQKGFSAAFLQTENTLIQRGKAGGVCRDKDGNVCLECTCGLVLSGKTDPANPLFTHGGSYWTNDSFPLLDVPGDQDPRLNPRNNCIHEGYASLALIPIRTQDKIVGLIHLNDRRKGCFTLETIEILEGIASHIGAALMRMQAEESLKRIEWMLTAKPAQSFAEASIHEQGYGDLTALNKDGIILKTMGPERLRAIADDYLELLATSSAIYEVNGDYAFGIFSSGWCRMMDNASRKRCGTEDNVEALNGGRWLCHESCWSDCSKEAISRQAPVDIACSGGIHLYAVPILAHGKVIGAINFGYGDPPHQAEKLRVLADRYRIPYDDLVREAYAYETRPTYIIELAKKRLHSTAKLIGSIVETKQYEEEKNALEDQLRQSQKMDAVGRLAGGVAHDFNNQLMVIMGNAELCLEQIDSGHPIRGHLDVIMRASMRSAEVTQQLLAFARKQTIVPRILDLNDAVVGMLSMLRRLIGEDIRLIWSPGVDLMPVKLDPAQMDQILFNLCVNARDAIDGVGQITVETGRLSVDTHFCAEHPEASPGAYVFLAVSDDGCGMDKETLAKIFEPFFTTKEIGKGTGLGLATVYGIVKQNNGFVYAYSEPGKGTTFKLYLPQVEPDTTERPEKITTEAPHGCGETVLLVEDEQSLGMICRRFLESLDYHVLLAETPAEALKMTEQHPGDIHVLLTDVVMPEMDGRQLAQRISAVKPGIQVLFMSGYTSDVIAQRGVLDEGVQFLSKPFSRDDLARKIREVLASD